MTTASYVSKMLENNHPRAPLIVGLSLAALGGALMLGSGKEASASRKENTAEASVYQPPHILIGYDRYDQAPFSPTNTTPLPSREYMQKELVQAQEAKDQARATSITNALTLINLCDQQNIPYSLAGLSREPAPLNSMFQRDCFPTDLVYCLPTVDAVNAQKIEQGYEHIWSSKQPTDVQSY